MPERNLQPGDLATQDDIEEFNATTRDKLREVRDLITSRQLMTVQHITKPLDEALNTLDDLYQVALDLALARNNDAPNCCTELPAPDSNTEFKCDCQDKLEELDFRLAAVERDVFPQD